MTVENAISSFDRETPNKFSVAEKIEWLSTADWSVWKEVMQPYSITPEYTGHAGLQDELLVPEPYKMMYLHFMEARVAYLNGDLTRYSNAQTMYNTQFTDFHRWFCRTHSAVGEQIRFF